MTRTILTAGLVASGLAAAAFLGLGSAPQAAGPLPKPARDEPPHPGGESAVLAGGCFWGVQGVFQHVIGVTRVVSGYAGGAAADATYDQVSTGTTGHAESVRIEYDPARVSYGDLLRVYFGIVHDPTELDRQGADTGTQYRSAIFYGTDEQRRIAETYIAQLRSVHAFPRPIVTQVVPLMGFYPAESYHRDYVERHPHELYCVLNDRPKIAALKSQLPELYKDR
jgi:peptide-methionine (S)-S-oxide reductase